MDRPAQENTSGSGEVKSAGEHEALHAGDAIINIAKGGAGQTTRSCVAPLTRSRTVANCAAAHARPWQPRTASVVFARSHDDNSFSRLDMAHEDVFVLTSVAVFSPDATLDARFNFRNDEIRLLRD